MNLVEVYSYCSVYGIKPNHLHTKHVKTFTFLYKNGIYHTKSLKERKSPCSPRDSQESSPPPQFKSINSSALSLLHSPTLTSNTPMIVWRWAMGKCVREGLERDTRKFVGRWVCFYLDFSKSFMEEIHIYVKTSNCTH